MRLKDKLKLKAVVLLVGAVFAIALCPVHTCAANEHHGIKKEESFFEKHHSIRKILRFLCIGSGITVGSVGIYYGGRWILDQINPERIQNRENAKVARSRLPGLRTELLRGGTSVVRKTELRQEISDCNSAMALDGSDENAIKNIFGVGGVISIAKLAFDAIDTIGDMSKKILNISFLKIANDQMKQIFIGIQGWLDAPAKEFNKEEAFSNFDKAFLDLEGQEEAEKAIRSYLYDIVVGKNQARWKNEKYSHGDVLYFHGPSGVGKSLVSQRLPYVLYSNPRVFVVTASDVDKEKIDSVVSQLFSSNKHMNVNPYFPTVEKTKGLVDFLKENPNGIVRIEEYDKICTPALDEVFRTIIECGVINVDGEKIDCSGAIFILTSNEDNVSMEGFEKADSPKLDKESIREGYTRVWHDKSFLNRVKKVEFKNLTAKAYASIIRKHFDEWAKYWADPENAGIKLVLSDEIIGILAKRVETLKQGARPIDLSILPSLQMQIGNKIKSAPNLDFYKNKTFYISYDSGSHMFEINEN